MLNKNNAGGKGRQKRLRKSRAHRLEMLEPRLPLASLWQNPARPLDVNNDGIAAPLDALFILNQLRESGSSDLPERTNRLDYYYDTNNDERVTPLDALVILNGISRHGGDFVNDFARVEGAAEIAPAGFISMALTSLPGNSDQLIEIYSSLTVDQKEFNEMGVFVTDDADGSVNGIHPSSSAYPDAVFRSQWRRVLYSQQNIYRSTSDTVFPAGRFLHFYVLQAASHNGEPASHLRVHDLEASKLEIAWAERPPAGDWNPTVQLGPIDATVSIEIGEPYNGNAAPVIQFIHSRSIDELAELNIQAIAMDANLPQDVLTYTLDEAPPGAVIDPQTGLFRWTPTEAQGPGNYSVTIRVTDQQGQFDTETFQLRVREVNSAPVIEPIADLTVLAGDNVVFQVQATDPDIPANVLTFSLEVGAPAGTSIDHATGLFSWQAPAVATVTTFLLTARVSDDKFPGLVAADSFMITVRPFQPGCAFDDELTGWNVFESGGPAQGAGSVIVDNCAAVITEGGSLRTELSRTITLANDSQGIKLRFDSPQFDTTAVGEMHDAFEVAVTDTSGNILTQPFAPGRTAAFNWSESVGPAVGAAAQFTLAEEADGGPHELLINLSHLPGGTQVIITARLINNDADNQTSVAIRGLEVVEGLAEPSTAFTSPTSRAATAPLTRWERLKDITTSIEPSYRSTSYTADRSQIISELVVTNLGSQTVTDELVVVLDRLSDIDTFVMHPDGILPDGRPYFDLTDFVDGALLPGQSTRPREIRFTNPGEQRFDYRLTTLGYLNAAPRAFTTTPIKEIEAGRTFRYRAEASDDDGHELSYSIVSGPAAMTIDVATSEVNWATTIEDVARHSVILRATDPFGLFVEQSFAIDVVATLQNRPPIFISDPVTDAIASSGFEISTIAVGPLPSGVDVISGFGGPRLVSVNAGDQTISVHAGQNNDRFDDTTVYSTGEPRPTGMAIDVGYSVDVGLPPFLVPGDSNDVLGMDQGDFNGDGILDLVVLTKRIETTKPQGQRDTIEITRMLGAGDGNFSPPTVIATIPFVSNSQAKHLRVADIDGDGHLDVVAIEETSSRLISVRGLGNGEFEPAVLTTLGTALNDFRMVDLDGDGYLDIVGRNWNIADFGWMRGMGDGTFETFVRLADGGGVTIAASDVSFRPYDFADLNGDGHLDIMLGEYLSGNVVILQNDGEQNFHVAVTIDPPGGNAGPLVVHVADFTGDGELDIFTVSSWSSRVDLFVGDGSGTNFTHQAGIDVLSWAGNAVGGDGPVDINGDGYLDIVLTNAGSGDPTSPQVLINDGQGKFTRIDYPMLSFIGHSSEHNQTNLDIARGAMFGDYNGDGVMDLAYMTAGNDFNGVGIRLGTRPGEFGATRTRSDATQDTVDAQVHAADFNGDGIVDLLILRAGTMLLGNVDGTFADPFPAVQVSRPGTFGAVADFNLDGLPDYVATRNTNQSPAARFYVALANGDGTFEVSDDQPAIGSFYGYQDIRIADFNNDGYPDIIAKAPVERFIDVYLNDPDDPGTFNQSFRTATQVTGVNTTGFTDAFAIGDFDGDGNVDFVAVDQASGEPLKLVLFSGDGAGNFSITNETFAFDDAMFPVAFYYPNVLQSGDVNGDGILDIVSFGWHGAIVHIGNGDGTFTSIDHYPRESFSQSAKDGYLIDFDEDGHLDLVHFGDSQTLTIRRGLGDGTFGQPERVGLVGGGGAITFADLDHDGHLDLAMVVTGAGNYNNHDVTLYFGTRHGLVDQAAVDLNGDGNEEILAVNEANDRLKIFVGDNLGGLTRQADLFTGRAPKAVTVGDLNGDGQLEIITANRAGRSISVFTGSIAAGYNSIEIPVGNGPIDVKTADVNGDGHLDVLVLDDSNNALWILAGSGDGTLADPIAIALGDKPGRFTLAETTGDGQLNAIITLPESNRVMILSGLNLQPNPPAPIYVNFDSSPSDVAVADLNTDGKPDLAVTLPSENVLSVLFGLGAGQFARPQRIAVGQQPTRVTLADADQDGRTDLIVANTGDGTASVIYNRFDPNEVYRYNSEAIDPDDDPITYSIVDGPGGLIINSETGALLWAASPDQVGVHDVTISADDGRGGIATQSFKIDVQPARDNAAPLFATEPQTTIGAGETFTYQAKALDNDRDPLRYRMLSGPTGASIDPTTGEVTWDARTDLATSFAPHGISSTGRIEVEADPSLQPASLTVEAWYNFHTLPASNQRTYLITQAGTHGRAYALYNFGNSSLRFEMDFGAPIHNFTYTIPFVPTSNRWYHIALTIDDASRTATVFVDGAAIGSTAIPDAIQYNPASRTQIGDSSAFYTRAIVDNYRIWNVVRTPAKIVEGMSQQYQDDSRIVLDYRFDLPDTLTVRDYSPAGNHGYRIVNGLLPPLVPGLANPGTHDFRIGVEDGRGGFDAQTFTVEILPELRGSIHGQLFEDHNGDGLKNTDEPVFSGWHLFIDTNGNGFPDPHEQQTTTDAQGNYRFDGLLPGNYPVRVTSVASYETPPIQNISVTANVATRHDLAIEQLSLSHIRGQLRTADDVAISHWRVFADLDGNGLLDENEPTAISDRDGHYSLTGLTAGEYRIRTELPAGWSDRAGHEGLLVILAADQIAAVNDFVLRATNTSVTGGLHFVTRPTSTIEARQTFRYASIATSIVDEPIAYELSLSPAGMTVDPGTGLLAWRPTIEQVGEHLVVLKATNESDSIALHDFHVEVTAPNTAPQLSVVPPAVAYVGLTYAVDLVSQDAEMHTVSFSLLAGPVGAILDTTTGRLRWMPASGDVESQQFSIELRDQLGAATVVGFTVDVLDSQPATTPLSFTFPRTQVGLGQDYVGRISGTDALGRPLTWSLVSGPTGMSVSESGNLTWTPSNSDLGEQTVQLRAADVDGGTEEISYVLFVVGRPVISGPVIVSSPIVSTVIGSDYRYVVHFSDADSDTVAFELLDSPVGMSIHPSLGTVHWIPTVDQLGERTVTIQVSDPDGRTDTQSFTLKVSRFGGPPIISSVPPTHASVGVGYLYTVAASDAERDPLTYRLLAAPAGMTIVEVTGEIAWTPTTDQIGQQEIVIEVSDGVGGAVTQAFAILVSAGVPNLPPRITTTAPRFGAVSSTYDYQVQAIDPEATEPTYALGQAPTGMTIDASTGQVTWTPTIEQAGKHIVTIRVIDAGGAVAIESFELDVLAENQPPLITGTAPAEVPAGATFQYDVRATDADFDQLSYVLLEAPDGATIDTFGRVHWKTTLADLGSHTFEVAVSDPRGGQATQSFSLVVIEDTEGPRVSLIVSPNSASRNVLPWQGPFRVYVRAIDNVEVAAVTLQANGRNIPLDAAGTATFNFEDWTFSTIVATATGIDIYGNTTTKTIDFKYAFPEGWSGQGLENVPRAIISSPADTASVTGMVTIAGTAAHEDFAAYKLSYRHVDETQFTEFHFSDTPVESAELGVWDTSLLINDEYVIRLEVATTAGVVNVVEHHVGLGGELKLGNFRLSFTDMVIPVAGIPIEITRIYDTLQTDREGDFGYGWRLEYRNTDLRVGLPKSGLEDIGIYSALRPGVKVFLNVPGQGRQGFTFNPDIRVLPGFGGNNLVLARPRFTPDPGVTSTLSTGTSSYLQVNEQGELYAPGGIPYNPASPNFGGAYVLTTREGITYRIDGVSGKLNTATDRNGNTLTFTESGIRSTLGAEVLLRRDNQGRIVEIIDALGSSTSYAYGPSGDLTASLDREFNRTTYSYSTERLHILDAVIDPLNRPLARMDYDETGRVIGLTDSSGKLISLAVSSAARQEVVTDVDGATSIFEYDNSGNLVRVIDAEGGITQYSVDQNGNTTSVTNALGETTTRIFDNVGNLRSETSPSGHTIRYTYDGRYLLTSITDALGRTTTYWYDAAGNLTSRRSPSGLESKSEYNEQGLLTSITDAAGNTTTFGYDSNGFQTSVTDAYGNRSQTDFDATGAIRSTVDALGNAFTAANNASGRPVVLTNPRGDISEFAYDSSGNLTTFVDSSGATVGFSYDALDRMLSTTDPSGFIISTRYDAVGNLASITTASGSTTDYTYDKLRRRTSVQQPASGAFRTGYDQLGRVVSETSGLGATTQYNYDTSGLNTSITDAAGNTDFLRYDAAGNLTEQRDRSGNVYRYIYDLEDRLIERVNPDDTKLSYEYHSASNRLTITNELGQSTDFQYDARGNLVRVTRPDRTSSHYEYDAAGNLVSQIDANGNVTTFEYDGLNRVTERRYPSGDTVAQHYNESGLVSLVTVLDETTQYAYDSAGRLIEISYPDGTNELFTYTPTGKIATASNSTGTVRYTYDEADRVLSIDYPNSSEIRYGYDLNGDLVSIRTSIGGEVVQQIDYSRNPLRKIAQVHESGELLTNYIFDQAGNITSIQYANGVTKTIFYNSRNFVEREIYAKDGELFEEFIYTTNAAGDRTAIRTSDDESRYLYDVSRRLIRETHFDASGNIIDDHQYQYDLVGNRIQTTANGVTELSEFNAADQLIRLGSATFSYDAHGRLVAKTTATGTTEYKYDAQGRLVEVLSPTQLIHYRYDAMGNQISRIVDGVTTHFLIDPLAATGVSEVLQEFNEDGEVTNSYVFGHDLIIQEHRKNAAFIHHDATGNVRIVTDANGEVAETFDYFAFGTLRGFTGQTEIAHLFGGERFYAEEQLTHLRARFYSPEIGSFLTRDPLPGHLEDPSTLHRYLYANANPLSFADPTGESIDWTLAGQAILQSAKFGLQATGAVVGAKAVFQFATTGRVDWKDLADTGARTFFYATIGKFVGPAQATLGYVLARKSINIFNTLKLISKTRDVYIQDLYNSIFLSEFVNPTVGQSKSAIQGAVAPGLSTSSVEGIIGSILVDLVVKVAVEVTGVDPAQSASDLVNSLEPQRGSSLNQRIIRKGQIDSIELGVIAAFGREIRTLKFQLENR